MSILLPIPLENYLSSHADTEPDILSQLSKETSQKFSQSVMLSGHLQGRLLSLISKLVRPKNILEIGTFTGYSAICLAEGLCPNGTLHTVDSNSNLKEIQDKYFSLSGYRKQIVQHNGNALEIIPKLDVTFDLVFIDADKHNYGNYFDLVIEKVKVGSCIISDNVLWKGEVYQNETPSKIAQNMIAYNQKVSKDKRVSHTIIPLRDGLSLCVVD